MQLLKARATKKNKRKKKKLYVTIYLLKRRKTSTQWVNHAVFITKIFSPFAQLVIPISAAFNDTCSRPWVSSRSRFLWFTIHFIFSIIRFVQWNSSETSLLFISLPTKVFSRMYFTEQEQTERMRNWHLETVYSYCKSKILLSKNVFI